MSDADIGDLPLSSYEHLGQDALCAICYQPSVDNVSMCAEGHNACRVCADKMVRSPHGTKCPIGCAKLLRPDGAWMSNRALNDVIKGTPFLCPHSGTGCKHSCLLAAMATHVADCGYTPMSCKCVGCNWRGPKCEWDAHMKEVDHGRYLVEMLMGTQEHVDKVAKSHTQWGEAVDKRLGSMYSLFENLHRTCQAIELKINSDEDNRDNTEKEAKTPYGCSKRSERRDKKTAKDLEAKDKQIEEKDKEIETLQNQLADAPSIAHFNMMKDELEWLPNVEEWRATQRELETATAARDRFFRERDDVTFQLEQSHGQVDALKNELTFQMEQSRGQKRMLEGRDASTNKRLHELHSALAHMLPHAVSRNCPCRACSV